MELVFHRLAHLAQLMFAEGGQHHLHLGRGEGGAEWFLKIRQLLLVLIFIDIAQG